MLAILAVHCCIRCNPRFAATLAIFFSIFSSSCLDELLVNLNKGLARQGKARLLENAPANAHTKKKKITQRHQKLADTINPSITVIGAKHYFMKQVYLVYGNHANSAEVVHSQPRQESY